MIEVRLENTNNSATLRNIDRRQEFYYVCTINIRGRWAGGSHLAGNKSFTIRSRGFNIWNWSCAVDAARRSYIIFYW